MGSNQGVEPSSADRGHVGEGGAAHAGLTVSLGAGLVRIGLPKLSTPVAHGFITWGTDHFGFLYHGDLRAFCDDPRERGALSRAPEGRGQGAMTV